VTATVSHPGVVRTSFGAEDQAAHMAGMIRVGRLFMKTPAQGTLTPVYLASSPEAEGVTGRYYANANPRPPARPPTTPQPPPGSGRSAPAWPA
jgi:retinol dehydrogenase 14